MGIIRDARKILGLPQTPSHRRQGIAEGCLLLDIPSTLSHCQATIQIQVMGQQCHDRIQAQQTRRGPFNRQVRPLALGLKAQVGAAFLERGLDAPALDETRHHITCLVTRTRREIRPWRVLGVTVTDQNPSERQWWLAAAVPQRRAAADLQASHAAIVPAHTQGLPGGRRVIETFGQGGQASALERRAPPRARLAWRRRFMENRIKAQGSDQAHPTAPAGMREFHDAVGLIAKHGDRDVRQPAPHHPDHLACPLGDGLVPQPQALTDLWRWRRHAQDGQGPATRRPWRRDNQGQYDPAQSTSSCST